MILFTLFASFILLSNACHPMCSYICDDPICPAKCVIKAAKPKCNVQCNSSYVPIQGQCPFQCQTVSNITDVCESDSCPIVETKCTNLNCQSLPRAIGCQIVCEQPIAGWYCTKPTNCRQPRCELQCERVACEFSVATHTNLMYPLFTILFTNILIYYN